MSFICDKYAASSQSLAPAVGMPAKVKVRALDLLQAWLEGYYSIDFKNSPEILDRLKAFLESRVRKFLLRNSTALFHPA